MLDILMRAKPVLTAPAPKISGCGLHGHKTNLHCKCTFASPLCETWGGTVLPNVYNTACNAHYSVVNSKLYIILSQTIDQRYNFVVVTTMSCM